MSEAAILKRVMIEVSKLNLRVFRNNVGMLKDKNGTMVRYGLCVGSSDLIGWTPVKITEAMIGKEVAIFTALEVKSPEGTVTPEQQNFIDGVRKVGGFSAVVRSEQEAIQAAEQWKKSV